VILLDSNILIYAWNADSPDQPVAMNWIEKLLGSTEVIALPWLTIWGFMRISTNPRIRSNPLTVD
jgi:hypothetical protein